MISAVIWATVQSEWGGEAKPLYPPGHESMPQRVVETALAADFDEIICVTGDAKSLRQQLPVADRRLFWLMNFAYQRSRSMAEIAGLWASNPESDAVMFLTADQSWVRPELINALIKKLAATSAWIMAPSINGEAHHPLLWHRRLYPELLQLGGTREAATLLARHRKKSVLMEWPDAVGGAPLEPVKNSARTQQHV